MTKKLSLILILIVIASCVFPLAACSQTEEELVLRISNCEDYIAETESEDGTTKYMYDDFVEWYAEKYGEKIRVEYSTFGTPEILYNNMKINPGSYDIVCPSDYMIQKMIAEDMLQPFTSPETDMPDYAENVSPYIKSLFDQEHLTPDGKKKYKWSDYAVPYMWGTMGFVYNPNQVTEEEASTWEVVLNEKFKNKTTIKDSIRDTYFLGLALANIDDLREKSQLFASIKKDSSEYTERLEEYSNYLSTTFNATDEETVDKVEALLKKAKANAYALEVDSGKDDMITGKVWLNFAWSGDAVYAMDQAEEPEDSPVYLNYAVPKEGSNIWFDGWVMPKGANEKLATAFLNYISIPENACTNMDYIGYTSAIGGEEVFERIKNSDYCVQEDEDGNLPENAVAIDLTYFFGKINGEDAVVYIDSENKGRQLECQYPSEEITQRCTLMQFFDEEANDRINSMWVRVKADDILIHVIVIASSLVLILLIFLAYKIITVGLPPRKPPKGFKKIN